MIATIANHNGEKCLMLVFDDGLYAIHHGMNVWTVFDQHGSERYHYNEREKSPLTSHEIMIHDYSRNHSGELGRISPVIIP